MTQKHTHKYHKVDGLWHCALADCTHFMPKNVAGNVVGKRSICWECTEELILDDVNMRSDKPRHTKCQEEYNTREERTIGISDFLAQRGL